MLIPADLYDPVLDEAVPAVTRAQRDAACRVITRHAHPDDVAAITAALGLTEDK